MKKYYWFQNIWKNIYLLKTGFPIVSSLQSSVLLVTPGRELSKADIPTPNILADPSHLENKVNIDGFDGFD